LKNIKKNKQVKFTMPSTVKNEPRIREMLATLVPIVNFYLKVPKRRENIPLENLGIVDHILECDNPNPEGGRCSVVSLHKGIRWLNHVYFTGTRGEEKFKDYLVERYPDLNFT